jgi:hypothetical protein
MLGLTIANAVLATARIKTTMMDVRYGFMYLNSERMVALKFFGFCAGPIIAPMGPPGLLPKGEVCGSCLVCSLFAIVM